MQSSPENQELYVQGIRNAHALETQAIQIMSR